MAVDFVMRIVSIGEVLWDVFEDSEKLGGAPFNFAVHASRLGHEVTFVSAVGDDKRGHAVLARASELGVRPDFIQVAPGAATGTVLVRVDSTGQPDFTIRRPAAYDALLLPGGAGVAKNLCSFNADGARGTVRRASRPTS